MKGDVKGLVGQGKQGQAKDIETATAAEPDTSKAVAKPVTPMAPENQSAPPAIPGRGRRAKTRAFRAAEPRSRQAAG